MERNDMEKLIKEDPDFIHAPKFQNSLNKFLAKNDNPLENGVIARLLLIPAEEVEALYEQSIVELKKEMCPDGESEG
jgi:hypothetical protein